VTIPDPPEGSKAVADVHSHGAYSGPSYADNSFAEADKWGNNSEGIDGYLVTPNGSLLFYDVQTGLEHVVGEDMPSDPNDPTRKNNNTPVGYGNNACE
jgi:hypothetical protein